MCIINNFLITKIRDSLFSLFSQNKNNLWTSNFFSFTFSLLLLFLSSFFLLYFPSNLLGTKYGLKKNRMQANQDLFPDLLSSV